MHGMDRLSENFCNMPHSGIIKYLELIVINKKTMSYWKTNMRLHTEGKLTEIEDVEIQHGIFQGNSSSPLLFSITLIPLKAQLNKFNTGYDKHTTKTKKSISHTLCGWFEADR
jgi:hypothetical protein